MTHAVELLWFVGCANHPAARRMLEEVIEEVAPGTPIRDIDATDAVTAQFVRFPGSPTIRVDGLDVDPSYIDPGEYTPRCRLYRTDAGLGGLPDRRWIESALRGPSPMASEDPHDARSTAPASSDDLALFVTETAALAAVCCAAITVVAGVAIAPIGGVVAVVLASVGAGVIAISSWRHRAERSV